MGSIDNQIDGGDPPAGEPVDHTAALDHFTERYPTLRRGLLFFFRRKRSSDPESLADEVLFRVLRRLLDGVRLGDTLEKYCTGVAKFVLRESWRRPPAVALPEELLSTEEDPLARFTEKQRWVLLCYCIQSIEKPEAEVWMRYYHEDRRSLAVELGVSENALRIRVYRAGKSMVDAGRKLLGAAAWK
jgi:DNA-directed RNA polymerase specialized sigma24 family protein